MAEVHVARDARGYSLTVYESGRGWDRVAEGLTARDALDRARSFEETSIYHGEECPVYLPGDLVDAWRARFG